jgi:hypothetical protein
MATSAAHPPPTRRAGAPGALWFGLFGAPAAWALQLMASYALTAHACFPGATPLASPAAGGSWTAALLVGVAALAASLAAGATAWGSWRSTHVGPERRTRFMALAGLLLSGIFLLGVLMNAIPLFLAPSCW